MFKEKKVNKEVLVLLGVVLVGLVLWFVVIEGKRQQAGGEIIKYGDEFDEQNSALVVKSVDYDGEKVSVLLENRYTKSLLIDRIAVYPSPDTPDAEANAVMIGYDLTSREAKEFEVPVDTKPYKLRVVTDNLDITPDIIMSEWEK